ncbi:hypothetical protein PLICRDRAFT_103799 [Plicaturopsis crispa FD-325 SS-3]|nr:hypothetical protein PLICRDRAFT_103799 [Plicaturopsis crispa FD-325 SS-3]
MIWERTWRILELMGLAPDFSKIAHAPPDGSTGVGFDYRRSDQPEEGTRFHLAKMPYGCIRFHRADFLDVLVNHLPDKIAHFGKRLTSYSKSDSSSEVTLAFADGSSATCDILVGCDGIKSLVRTLMLESKAAEGSPELLDYIEPRWTGTIAYRGLIPADKFSRNHRTLSNPMMYCGKSKHIVSYSISQGSIVNVVALTSQPHLAGAAYDGPWVEDCSREELLACYAGWEPEVIHLLECIDKPTRWALHQLRPLPTWTADRVVLVGDSAHGMAPHQGAGAGQAIEDAYLLASLLSQSSTNITKLGLALSAYEKVRLPMANAVLLGSYEAGMKYEFNSVFGEDYASLGPAIQRQWDWVWKTTPEEDVDRARNIMKGSLAKL